jgi:hypothetical protein
MFDVGDKVRVAEVGMNGIVRRREPSLFCEFIYWVRFEDGAEAWVSEDELSSV